MRISSPSEAALRRTLRPGRIGLAVLGLLFGCEPPQPAPPVSFDGHDLSAERLAELLVLGQPMPVDEGSALRLAEHWLEMAALGRAVLDGDDAVSTEDVPEAATRWERRRTVGERYLVERVPTRTVTPEEVEVLYGTGELRLIAHIVRVASPRATRAEQNRQEQAARDILEFLRGGGSWEEARASSEDPAAARAGILGLFARGELSPPLDRAAFALEPGAISGVVPSPVGFHILYRPRLEDVRPYFVTLLEERATRIRRAAVADSLAEAAGPSLADGALESLRTLARGPGTGDVPGTDALVRFDSLPGGDEGVTTAWVAEAIRRLSADERREMAQGTRPQLEGFLRRLATDYVIWTTASEAGVRPDDADEAFLEASYRSDVAEAVEALGLAQGDGDEALGPAVDAYLEAVVARRRSQVTVPPGLFPLILGSRAWRLSDEGMARALSRASSLLAGAETGP